MLLLLPSHWLATLLGVVQFGVLQKEVLIVNCFLTWLAYNAIHVEYNFKNASHFITAKKEGNGFWSMTIPFPMLPSQDCRTKNKISSEQQWNWIQQQVSSWSWILNEENKPKVPI
jgi:hypothetical protein